MKRFHFRLERILELKKYAENQWEIKLGEITGRCEQLKRELRDLVSRRHQVFMARTCGDSLHLSVSDTYIRRLDMKSRDITRRLDELEIERAGIQEKYLTAAKERKIYDTLKDKQAASFKKEEMRREYMEIDDVNSGAAARRQGGMNGGC
ncbi:MAG: flagellar export protein FliJ [Spirochaetales bacterium]|nr:flagellar export protein FliJ [Spirochaetales bacterium]